MPIWPDRFKLNREFQSKSNIVREWFEGEDADDLSVESDDYPWPTEYVRRKMDGPLADAVRSRLEVNHDIPVFITESVEYGGTDVTQENDYNMTLECGDHKVDFNESMASENFNKLLRWIDGLDG